MRKKMGHAPRGSSEFEEKVIEIKRVAKKTKGGNKIGFTALVVVGDRKGKVGSGLGKARDVSTAIRKAIEVAKRDMVNVNTGGHTIVHSIKEKYGSAELLLKPAPEGLGIVAGGAVRQVLDMAAVKNVSAKMLGSNNKTCNVRCVISALRKLQRSYDTRKDTENKRE